MDRSSHHSREPINNMAIDRTPVVLLPSATSAAASAASSGKGNNERSAVVLALFGPSVGPCVGDFSTTYNRVNGRLYAATRAVLFYSNLFGFERRLCLNLSDIESIEPYRATSIRINMVDCEDHVFRKFFHRDEVLKVLQRLYERVSSPSNNLTEITRTMELEATPIRRTNNTELLRVLDTDNDEHRTRARFESDLSQADSTTTGGPTLLLRESAMRPRSQSVPSVTAFLALPEKSNKIVSPDNLTTKPKQRKFRRAMSLRSPVGKIAPPLAAIEPTIPASSEHDDDTEVSGLSAPPAGFDMAKAWAEAKQPYSEVAIKNVVLSCSLEAFMDMFVSDDALFPIALYQKEHIHDTQLVYSKWKKRQGVDDGDDMALVIYVPPMFDRNISFIHPLNNAVGPSQAQTNRRQCFQRFGTMGATLQNTTVVQGVPGAECFRVEDRWIVETIDETSVHLSVYFQVIFFKRTMFKPIIQKNVKSETKKWYQGYVKFIKHALHEDDKKEGRGTSPSALTSENEIFVDDSVEQKDATARSLWSLATFPSFSVVLLLGVLLLFAVGWMLVQLFHVQRSVNILEKNLLSIREENKELLDTMKQILDSNKKC